MHNWEKRLILAIACFLAMILLVGGCGSEKDAEESTSSVENSQEKDRKTVAGKDQKLVGDVVIEGDAVFGQLLEAEVKNSNCTGSLQYQWRRGEMEIVGATTSVYELVQEDIGQEISCIVSCNTEAGELVGILGAVVAKTEGPAAPKGLKSIKTSSMDATDGVILGADGTMEYADNEEFLGAASATDVMKGLKAGKYYVRVKETETQKAGDSVCIIVMEGDELDSALSYWDPNGDGSVDIADQIYMDKERANWVDRRESVVGRQVLIYRFGGDGNDWCFVRTPADYDPNRKQPYPFVICNHGNGWVMDGSKEKANWTKQTMYLPLTDPSYLASPTSYNGTNDESLWYSNPTIEALLDAGYIVCGCENYGKNLYGNDDCRKACVAFYNHMLTNYNVENACYMIGSSNGALTSLNAAYLLKDKVKAMVLIYPLTCLVNQYIEHPAHQEEIRKVYGITDPNISIAELTEILATHDPLTTDVVDGKKVGYFPPVKIYYSKGDTTTKCSVNALPLADLLENSGKEVSLVECTGQHGNPSHFKPDECVEWFNSH